MDEGRPTWNDSLSQKKTATPPAFLANRTFQPLNESTISDSTEMNVSKVKAMFEGISKSQEMIDNIVTKNSTQYVQ